MLSSSSHWLRAPFMVPRDRMLFSSSSSPPHFLSSFSSLPSFFIIHCATEAACAKSGLGPTRPLAEHRGSLVLIGPRSLYALIKKKKKNEFRVRPGLCTLCNVLASSLNPHLPRIFVSSPIGPSLVERGFSTENPLPRIMKIELLCAFDILYRQTRFYYLLTHSFICLFKFAAR